jgi:hypothetical protein
VVTSDLPLTLLDARNSSSSDLSDKLVPGSLLPSFVGEFSLAVWLTVKRVNVDAAPAS